MRLALASAAAGLAAAAVALRLWRQRRVVQQEAQDRLDQLEGLVSRQSQTLKQYEAALAELRSQTDSAESSRPVLYRIVLTGGPCAGKTTALADIKARLQSLGFAVLCVPEVATLLFGGGAPFPVDEVKRSSPLSRLESSSSSHTPTLSYPLQATGFTFQKNLLRLQLSIEEAFIDLATHSGRPSVILLDRGAMDGKAYMSEAQWELMLEEAKLTPVMMRDQRYDAILHLVTAAAGAESFYTLTNNTVRHESPEQARAMDQRTLDCWTGHEHLYIVDNSTPFEEKIRRESTAFDSLCLSSARLTASPPLSLHRCGGAHLEAGGRPRSAGAHSQVPADAATDTRGAQGETQQV